MSELRYVYFGDKTGTTPHKGLIAIGYCYNEKERCMDYAIAFCSPNDRFVKAKAHRILTARMENGMTQKSVIGDIDQPPKFPETVKELQSTLLNLHLKRVKQSSEGGKKTSRQKIKFAGIAIPRWFHADLFI